MSDFVYSIADTRLLIFTADGPHLSRESDAHMFISAAWSHEVTMVAIPVERLSDDFFRLNTRLAGEVVQKFANYRLRLAIVGDISKWISESGSLRDFVYEANHGTVVWFADNLDQLYRRITVADK